MKVASIACFLGAAVASASGASIRASSGTEELANKWNELAAEASYMQVAIKEQFTYGQCIAGCENPDFDGNRARCRKNCDQLDENGDTTDNRTDRCTSCDGFPFGGNRWNRCMDACETRRNTAGNICGDATNTDECYDWCVGGSASLDDCLRSVGGGGGSDRDNRCIRVSSCSKCRRWCSSNGEIDDCLAELRCDEDEFPRPSFIA